MKKIKDWLFFKNSNLKAKDFSQLNQWNILEYFDKNIYIGMSKYHQ